MKMGNLTMTPPETSVSRYIPEKEQMIEALNQFTSNKCTTLEISLSHEKKYSVAFVITL